MKKIIIALIILLLIAGCVKLPNIPGKLPGQTTGKKDFVGGTKGVEAEIVSPAEGGKIYLDMPFNVAVRVTNEGEAKAEGTTCIFGSFTECECQDFVLEEKRKSEGEKPEGEEKIIVFEGGKIEEKEEAFITAKTRYDYKTYGITTACVKKDAYSKEGCQISGNIMKSASSAPVTIQEVKEEIITETAEERAKIILTIKIEDSGKGELYGLDEDKAQCETQDMKKEINVRLVNAPGRSTCNPAQIREGEATTKCVIEDVRLLDESYESEITLELEYVYETIDTNKFEVGL